MTIYQFYYQPKVSTSEESLQFAFDSNLLAISFFAFFEIGFNLRASFFRCCSIMHGQANIFCSNLTEKRLVTRIWKNMAQQNCRKILFHTLTYTNTHSLFFLALTLTHTLTLTKKYTHIRFWTNMVLRSL
jgi:hypothetical protein